MILSHEQDEDEDMSEITELIERYGPSFCVLPWKHLYICDTGTCKLCCSSLILRDDNHQYFTVYTSRLADIWNSDAMRRVRRAMVAGEPVPDCAHSCIAVEALGGFSRRLMENKSWETEWGPQVGLTIDNLKDKAVRNDFYVESAPFDMAIEIDNVCNLACRMCSAERSSRVENDPVHSRWAGRNLHLPKWKDNTLELGPNRLIFGTYKGFHAFDRLQKVKTLWTTARAEMHLPNVNEYLETVEIRLAPESVGRQIHISINGRGIYSNNAEQNIIIDLKSHFADLCLVFESETGHSTNFNSPVGIGLEYVAIKRSGSIRPSTQLLYNRFPGKNHWMEADAFLFEELFPKGVQQQRLRIEGGEALINKNVARIIKNLTKNGNSKNQRISFTTNGTVFNEDVFKQAKKFKLMVIAVSIDAIGESIEYIRHGVRWNVVEKNLKRMRSVKNVYLIASNTLQAYNALEISEVLRFCDRIKIRCFSSVINFPRYLSIISLPPIVREKAIQRLQAYTDENKNDASQNRMTALTFISALKSSRRPFDPQELRKFMLFTNDLDSSRGQNIRETFPELVRLIEKAGYPWIDEHFYFPVEQARQCASG